ncbi:MAG: pyridoxal phosphate-dependent aminotransferase [Rhodospirillales bacterium]|nr:pyridoxal phosphate-dependent aminotransferase [Rhodospirillales bacterium]
MQSHGSGCERGELDDYVRISRDHGCSLILDEFYSHFIYTDEGQPGDGPVSAAAHVDDVNRDPVVVIDGMTKSFRYPGWRVGWAVGPADMIEILNRVGSSVDGGPCQPMQQRAVIKVLEPARADQETTALRAAFARKRNLTVERLADMGIKCAQAPQSTFYAWATVEDLPPPLNEADGFFRAALQHKVMTVPGQFFDVNPGNVRTGPSPYGSWLRFSFGPPEDNVRMGLDRLAKMIADA